MRGHRKNYKDRGFCAHSINVRTHLLCILFLTLFFLSSVSIVYSKSLLDYQDGPVNFTADSLVHDEENQLIYASGNVELTQGLQILRADTITYNLKEDRVHAEGDISLLDENGNVLFATEAELKSEMKEGFTKSLLTLLEDGSRFTAESTETSNNGTVNTMKNATYTMCNVCEADPKPLWQMKADEVTHDKTDKSINYKNARLEVLGIPIAYAPSFSHPDPTVKQKSGVLRPRYGWTTSLGAHIDMSYYHTFSPSRDATFRFKPTALSGVLIGTEFREQFNSGYVEVTGTAVNSDRKEEDGRIEGSVTRGHISVDSQFNINDTWRMGMDVTRSSDKQYLNLYDISSEDILNNKIYAERFSGRNYSRIAFTNYQDLRLGDREDQPDILPSVEHVMISEPNSILGGRWKTGVSALILNRQAKGGQDMQRASLETEWERRNISDLGLVNVMSLTGRGDFYAVQNSIAALSDPTIESNLTVGRGLATASFISSYPLIKPMSSSKAILEPIVGVNLSPDISTRIQDEIPNEDSIDIRLDSLNLFETNRFPGIDRQENGGRINYGLKAGIYGNDGRYGKIFFGQSYRIYGEQQLFPEGSGLEERSSDIIGNIKLGLSDYFETEYSFQFDHASFEARRHEVQVSGGDETYNMSSRYIYVDTVSGTGFDESREQLYMDGNYNVTENWQLSSSALMDLGDEPGFRSASLGVGYSDECFSFLIKGGRKVVDEASGENDTSLTFRIGLKNIGEFKTSNDTLLKNDNDT